jgi:hypothetical protein
VVVAELELPYVPIDPGIEESEKMDRFLALAGMLDDPFGPLRIVRFLLWVGRNRPTGHVGTLTGHALGRVMLWPAGRDPEECKRAMIDSGWLTEDETGALSVVNWDRHGGKVLRAREDFREKEATRKRRQRCKKANHSSPSCDCPGFVPRDIPETSQGSPADVPVMKGEGRRVKGDLDLLSASQAKLDAVADPSPRPKAAKHTDPRVPLVWAAYRQHHPRAPESPPEKSRKLIAARLKEGWDADTLITAINGIHVNPHHLGDNDRTTKYLALENAIRDDRVINLALGYWDQHGGKSAEEQIGDDREAVRLAIQEPCARVYLSPPVGPELDTCLRLARGDPEVLIAAIERLARPPSEPDPTIQDLMQELKHEHGSQSYAAHG